MAESETMTTKSGTTRGTIGSATTTPRGEKTSRMSERSIAHAARRMNVLVATKTVDERSQDKMRKGGMTIVIVGARMTRTSEEMSELVVTMIADEMTNRDKKRDGEMTIVIAERKTRRNGSTKEELRKRQ